MPQKDALTLRFLGELSVERGSQPQTLPQSKKTRALLAYVVLSDRPQRRDRLCSLFWDVADDPRGALRWCLSRLRPLVDSPRRARLVTDRDHVSFDREGVSVDVLEARNEWTAVTKNPAVGKLEAVLSRFRGDFLEGLELPDFDEFQAWLIAEREQNRLLRAQLLAKLVELLGGDPPAALPYAQTRVQIDPLNDAAHASLTRLLLALGRGKEARRQHESGMRLLKEAGMPAPLLSDVWLAQKKVEPAPIADVVIVSSGAASTGAPTRRLPALVGRDSELAELLRIMERTKQSRQESVVLVTGEPGIGKTRLMTEVLAAAKQKGATVLDGAAFEAEATRPYGPWIDALRKIPRVTVGSTLGADLAPLVPEFSPTSITSETREQLFGAGVQLIAARVHSAGMVVLALDDAQWLDDASAELLHYVVRSNRHRPLMVLIAARAGELPDNTSMVRVLRGLRRDSVNEEIAMSQIELQPLSVDDARNLAGQIDPNLRDHASIPDTAGNPLFILEFARSSPTQQEEALPTTLVDVVRDRVERLPPPVPEVLRWGAALGVTFTTAMISELSGLDSDALMRALETLERNGLIHGATAPAASGASYAFSHEIVRRVVYSTISEPRRRIMHARIAALMARLQDQNESLTPSLVHHAALAGDAALAAGACVAAGARCLRLFANLQAESFARRGARFAEQLEEPERVKLLIDLARIAVGARLPAELDAEGERMARLAECALDYGCMAHARLAFHLSSYLRWAGGDWSIAGCARN
jgi:DNA-binding SARP family transcriptional activator